MTCASMSEEQAQLHGSDRLPTYARVFIRALLPERFFALAHKSLPARILAEDEVVNLYRQ